jgi:hypothetical protein
MGISLSNDLRVRVVEMVLSGSSRRQAVVHVIAMVTLVLVLFADATKRYSERCSAYFSPRRR